MRKLDMSIHCWQRKLFIMQTCAYINFSHYFLNAKFIMSSYPNSKNIYSVVIILSAGICCILIKLAYCFSHLNLDYIPSSFQSYVNQFLTHGMVVGHTMCYVNSAINPYIYYTMSQAFKDQVMVQ